MPRAAEIQHFSHLLAALTVSVARATTQEQLAEIHEELAETFVDVLSLLSHDAVGPRGLELAREFGSERREVRA